MKKRVVVEIEFELGSNDKDLTEEEIMNDIQKSQDQIGWDYYYTVKSVHVVN